VKRIVYKDRKSALRGGENCSVARTSGGWLAMENLSRSAGAPPHCCKRRAARSERKFLNYLKSMLPVEGNIPEAGCFKVGGHVLAIAALEHGAT